MKKYLIVLLIALFAIIDVKDIHASSATTNTYALDKDGSFVVTQDGYLPDNTILDLGLSDPEDIYIDENDIIYIADTGNSRIVVYDPLTDQIINTITSDLFSSPRGIYLTEDDELYVADSGAELVFKFATDGTLLETYDKPDSVSFEATTFNPKKVAVDKQKNMYIVAEGVFDGLIQLSDSGEFLGYFATNDVVLTLRQRFENFLFSEEQLEQVGDRNPISFSNVYVDQNGIKYSTSFGVGIENLKKHNTDGSNNIDTPNWFDLELVDLYTDKDGIIYAASETGFVYVFTNNGSLIFGFGAQTDGEDVAGLYKELVSIAIDSTGRIWTLDQQNASLQSYTPTEYATTIYEALTLYQNGQYDLAVIEWETVLQLNQLSVLAHNEIGRNLFSQGDYEESLHHFELSGNRWLYSQSYWEVRNIALQNNLPFFLIGTVLAVIGYYTIKLTNRKYGYLAGPKQTIQKVKDVKVIDDVLYSFNLLKHPLDSFYYLKKGKKGSYLGATIIFGLFFVSYFIFVTSKGFIYQMTEASEMDINAIVLGFFSISLLFVVCNFLVASISDGEGSLGQLYKAIMYTFIPIIIAYLLATFLSYYFTYNEVFILQLIQYSGMGWTGLLIFLAISETHNYTIRTTIKSILLTVLFMLILAVLFAFVQIMGDQLVQFIIALFEEAIRSVG